MTLAEFMNACLDDDQRQAEKLMQFAQDTPAPKAVDR